MSRRRAAEKRTILPDHKYKDLVLAKFMNRIMLDGKKSTSEKIVYGAFDIVSKKTDKILKICNNSEYRRLLGKNARDRVKSCFDIKKITYETLALYETLLQRFGTRI